MKFVFITIFLFILLLRLKYKSIFIYEICSNDNKTSIQDTYKLCSLSKKSYIGINNSQFIIHATSHGYMRQYTMLHLQSDFYKVQKRFHSGNAFVNNLTKKVISPQMLVEQKNMLKNKAIFLRYCEHFKTKTLSDLLNDKIFIQEMHDSIHNEPTLFSRAFQLALEVTYFKRRFSEQVLQEIYKNDFVIQDSYNVNNGVCDQSTIYSSILAKKVTTYFNLEVKDVTVNSTPIFLTKDKITEYMKMSMEYNKKMTENTCPDIVFKDRPYDFKDSKNVSFGKNHVYFLDAENIRQEGIKIFNNLESSLKGSLHKNNALCLSKEARFFTELLLENLQNYRIQNIPAEMRLDKLNFLLAKSNTNVPKDFKLPIIIKTKKACVDNLNVSTDDLKNVSLDDGYLDAAKARKSIMGVLDSFDLKTKLKIQEITHNSIQFDNTTLEVN